MQTTDVFIAVLFLLLSGAFSLMSVAELQKCCLQMAPFRDLERWILIKTMNDLSNILHQEISNYYIATDINPYLHRLTDKNWS